MGAYFQKYYLRYLKPPTNIGPLKMVTKPKKNYSTRYRLGKIPLPGCPALPGRGAGQRRKKVALPGELPGLKEEILGFLVLQTRPRYHF